MTRINLYQMFNRKFLFKINLNYRVLQSSISRSNQRQMRLRISAKSNQIKWWIKFSATIKHLRNLKKARIRKLRRNYLEPFHWPWKNNRIQNFQLKNFNFNFQITPLSSNLWMINSLSKEKHKMVVNAWNKPLLTKILLNKWRPYFRVLKISGQFYTQINNQ